MATRKKNSDRTTRAKARGPVRTYEKKLTTSAIDRRDRLRRLHELSGKILDYDLAFAPKDLEKALSWSKARFTSSKIATVNDTFSDPLLIAEHLVDFAKADRETILASVLYPAVRPIGREGIDNRGLVEIENMFGARVRTLVERTLRLYSLDYLPLSETAAQSKDEHLRLFNLMSLWIAGDPRAILIRITQRIVNLDLVSEITPREIRADLIWRARYIAAPLAYIAGYFKLRQELLDRCYHLEDPYSYASTSRSLSTVGAKKLTEEELNEAKDEITDFVRRKIGLGPQQFLIEMRRKRPASARDKAARKGQAIEQLGDRFAFRIILKANLEQIQNFVVNKLDNDEHDILLDELGGKCLEIYAALSREWGRGGRAGEIREAFKTLAKLDPHPQKDSTDARFDNYIKNPKDSGYSAVQDTFFLKIGEKLIEFEGQIVDELRHEINTYGPRAGHVFYKTGLSDHSDVVLDWYKNAAAIFEDNESGPKHIFVFDDQNQIVGARDELTVDTFIQKAYGDGANKNIIGVSIDNDDSLAERVPGTFYGPLERLKNGDRVLGPQFR